MANGAPDFLSVEKRKAAHHQKYGKRSPLVSA